MLNIGGTITFTASAIHGPLGFTWDAPGGLSMSTNGNYLSPVILPGIGFSVNTVGQASTLTLSNIGPSLVGMSFNVYVTNTAFPANPGSGPGFDSFTVGAQNWFPTPALWTANFQITNANNVAGYKNFGAISTGAIWNPIRTGTASGGYWFNVSSSNEHWHHRRYGRDGGIRHGRPPQRWHRQFALQRLHLLCGGLQRQRNRDHYGARLLQPVHLRG